MDAIGPGPGVDFYDSPYLAEHWDLLGQASPGYNGDGDLYWRQLLDVKQARGSDDLLVVDMGTGTGRVLKSLNRMAEKHQKLMKGVKTIGVDVSQHMIDRAADSAHFTHLGPCRWVCASALDLNRVVQDQPVDLLIMSVGSIGHLHQPGEFEAFFQAVASCLRRGSGRACVSIWSDWLLSEGNAGVKVEPKPQYPSQEYPSQRFPDIVYRTTFRGDSLAGKILVSRTDVEVIRTRGNGDEERVEMNETALKVRIVNETDLRAALKAQGLQVVGVDRTAVDTVFTLSLL